MSFKNRFKEYFEFSKRERNAVIILIVLILLFLVLPAFFKSKKAEIPIIDLAAQKQLDSVLAQNDKTLNNYDYNSNNSNDAQNSSSALGTVKLNLFNFDPNTLSEEGFQKLGLPQRNITTILHYREKGGKFRRPEDIKKIYGLNEDISNQLIPFIKITGEVNKNFNNDNSNALNETYVASPKEKYHTVNINTATEEEWKSLPGIGDVLSKRIVKFRTSIGGFKSVDDIGRTYGLPDSTFQKIKPYLILE